MARSWFIIPFNNTKCPPSEPPKQIGPIQFQYIPPGFGLGYIRIFRKIMGLSRNESFGMGLVIHGFPLCFPSKKWYPIEITSPYINPHKKMVEVGWIYQLKNPPKWINMVFPISSHIYGWFYMILYIPPRPKAAIFIILWHDTCHAFPEVLVLGVTTPQTLQGAAEEPIHWWLIPVVPAIKSRKIGDVLLRLLGIIWNTWI